MCIICQNKSRIKLDIPRQRGSAHQQAHPRNRAAHHQPAPGAGRVLGPLHGPTGPALPRPPGAGGPRCPGPGVQPAPAVSLRGAGAARAMSLRGRSGPGGSARSAPLRLSIDIDHRSSKKLTTNSYRRSRERERWRGRAAVHGVQRRANGHKMQCHLDSRLGGDVQRCMGCRGGPTGTRCNVTWTVGCRMPHIGIAGRRRSEGKEGGCAIALELPPTDAKMQTPLRLSMVECLDSATPASKKQDLAKGEARGQRESHQVLKSPQGLCTFIPMPLSITLPLSRPLPTHIPLHRRQREVPTLRNPQGAKPCLSLRPGHQSHPRSRRRSARSRASG